jgi:hypothetical protein
MPAGSRRFNEGGMTDSFRKVETDFQSLRRRFRDNEISRREFIDQLKKLRLRDGQGRFWMIGAQTGKWYFFDGQDWVLSDPPSEDSGRVKCPACGLESEAAAENCAECGAPLREEKAACPGCGEPLQNSNQTCPSCGRGADASPLEEEILSLAPQEDFVVRRLRAASVFLFSGGTGLILGLILGVFAGASDFFSGMDNRLPDALGMLQGTLMGGVVFAALGGLLGFVFLGTVGFLLGLLFNALAAILGGFPVTLDRSRAKKEESEKNV